MHQVRMPASDDSRLNIGLSRTKLNRTHTSFWASGTSFIGMSGRDYVPGDGGLGRNFKVRLVTTCLSMLTVASAKNSFGFSSS